jgi:hypothetical protein
MTPDQFLKELDEQVQKALIRIGAASAAGPAPPR